jgi:hypothetical protein
MSLFSIVLPKHPLKDLDDMDNLIYNTEVLKLGTLAGLDQNL